MIDQEKPEVCLTLVHGTWGRGFFPGRHRLVFKRKPDWFDVRSPFTTRLKSKLDDLAIGHTIQIHKWSGANSIRERAQVAGQLANQIKYSMARYSNAEQVIIAHSHGGNIVRLALKTLPDWQHVLVITMGTPFIEVLKPMRLKERSRVLLKAAVLLPAIHPMILIFETFRSSPWIFYSLYLSILLYIFLLWKVMPSILFNEQKMNRLREHTEHCMDWNNINLRVIRTVDDEAGLWLASGAIGNRIMTFMVGMVEWFWDRQSCKQTFRNRMIIAAIILFGYGIGLYFPSVLAEPTRVMVHSCWFIALTLIGVVFVTCILVGNACKSVYGREMFFGTFPSEVNSHSAPDGGISMRVITISENLENRRGFRHSIYDDEATVSLIVDEIRNWCQNLENSVG